jgi:Methylase involved in ubiquinone/menaquinone biosynthesis
MNDGTKTNWQDAALPSWYNKNMLGYEDMRRYAALFEFNSSDEVLDLGCGDGTFFTFAAPLVKTCTGVDVSEPQLKEARVKLDNFINISFVKSSFQDINFKEGSFTKISMRKALHHLNNDEKGVLIDKACKWLKPGGIFIIEDLITSFALHRKEERKAQIEAEAARYYGERWPQLHDAFFTTLYKELPCDLAQLTHHLLFTGFCIRSVTSQTCFMATVKAQK